MSKRIYIGFDNGVSGSIGILKDGEASFWPLPPLKRVAKYTKKKGFINRIAHQELVEIVARVIEGCEPHEILATLERPMVNPKRFTATASALRAWEALLIVVEILGIPYEFIDSKEWQKSLLPSGTTGDDLKVASLSIGKRLFPSVDPGKAKDMDGLLIAEYKRRMYEKQ